MAETISNTTLAILIVTALVISIIGTWLVLNKPIVMVSGISGAIVGNASFNVTAISSVKFFNATFSIVNFGNINVTDCSPWFVSGTNTTPPCYNNTEDDNPNPFVVENDGGNKVNVTISGTNPNLASTSSHFAFKLANASCYHNPNNASGGCNTGGVRLPAELNGFCVPCSKSTGGVPAVESWRNVTSTVLTCDVNGLGSGVECPNVAFLNFTDSNDTFMIDVAARVGSDESAGAHNSTMTFTASASGNN
ncbi:MAG TPA: hypothetical protein VGQ00_02795 [Candidatus Norongarragalinales archaeon]|jgi:hypothetical protein|nr:hypothetical protein [Candidatus Norongarragalinales archaeon]